MLFVQSHVASHTELAWVFNTVTPIGELERMTQFKDKSQRQESILAGLLNYPVLQAADVLLYKADLVPVGEDQVQHVELMREIVRKWNARFGADFFPEPKAMIGTGKRIMGLDGQGKMSKSLGNHVGMLDEPEAIWNSLRPALTDPARVTKKDPGTPEKCNLYDLHQQFSPLPVVEEVAIRHEASGEPILELSHGPDGRFWGIAFLIPGENRFAVAARTSDGTRIETDLIVDFDARARRVRLREAARERQKRLVIEAVD